MKNQLQNEVGLLKYHTGLGNTYIYTVQFFIILSVHLVRRKIMNTSICRNKNYVFSNFTTWSLSPHMRPMPTTFSSTVRFDHSSIYWCDPWIPLCQIQKPDGLESVQGKTRLSIYHVIYDQTASECILTCELNDIHWQLSEG